MFGHVAILIPENILQQVGKIGSKPKAMMEKILSKGRYLLIVAVLGSYLTAAIIILYTGAFIIHIIIELILHPNLSTGSARQLTFDCIEAIDVFLLGTAFYIVAFGLYELFISHHASTPNSLGVKSLEDLKAKLLGVIIVVLSVFFLEQVINWDGKRDILALGIAEALVIGAIALTIKLQGHEHKGPADTHVEAIPLSSSEIDEESTNSGPASTQESDERGQ